MLKPQDKVMIDVRDVFSGTVGRNYQTATVIDLLDSQFTAELPDGHVVYRFYRDLGGSWKMIR